MFHVKHFAKKTYRFSWLVKRKVYKKYVACVFTLKTEYSVV